MSLLQNLLWFVLEPIDRGLGLIPLEAAPVFVLALLLLPCFWVARMSRERIYRGAPDSAGWRDLRFWAFVVVAPYVAIYLLAAP